MRIKLKSVGSDPEVFLVRNGDIVSSIGIVGGSKDKPREIGYGYFIQEDNILVEFNIPPASSKDEFIDNINTGKELLADELDILGGYRYKILSSAILPDKVLNCKKANMFGCEPDYNVWKQITQEPPHPDTNLRTCGGHIHVGYNNPDLFTSELLGKCMDITVGLNSLFYDKDSNRRKLYGKAGSVRFKTYGIEYRSVSNYWIADDNLISNIYDKVVEAVALANNPKTFNIIDDFKDSVVEAINTSNLELAKKVLNKLKKEQLITN